MFSESKLSPICKTRYPENCLNNIAIICHHLVQLYGSQNEFLQELIKHFISLACQDAKKVTERLRARYLTHIEHALSD